MEAINIHDAKTHFSKLVHRTESGESIVIARDGEPVAMLVPFLKPVQKKRVLGGLRGKMRVTFDEKQWKMTDEELLGL
jgi:prevent-host-death family protein